MDVSLRASEHTRDFQKPVTVQALALFDPELELVFNRRHDCFQVMRVRPRKRVFDIEGVGEVAFIENVHVHVTDWAEGLQGRDDPYSLIRHLWKSDTQRHSDLQKSRDEAIREHRDRVRRTVQDNYRHAFRDNQRLILSAMEPFYNFPHFVK